MIKIKVLNMSYQKEVLINFNLEVKENELCVIMGESGSGKTTLLDIISGVVDGYDGEVLLDGVNINDLPVQKRQIGYVFQDFALYPNMSVYENVAFGLKLRKLKKDEIKKQVNEMLEYFSLTDIKDKNVTKISGGQKQRTALARALITKPKLLLMDEPLSNLDVHLKSSIIKEIKRIKNELDVTILLVTHSKQEAYALADQLVLLSEGRIIQKDTPYNMCKNPINIYVDKYLNGNFTNYIKSDKFNSIFGEEIQSGTVLGIRYNDFVISDSGVTFKVIDRVIVDDHYVYTLQNNDLVVNVATDFNQIFESCSIEVKLKNIRIYN